MSRSNMILVLAIVIASTILLTGFSYASVYIKYRVPENNESYLKAMQVYETVSAPVDIKESLTSYVPTDEAALKLSASDDQQSKDLSLAVESAVSKTVPQEHPDKADIEAFYLSKLDGLARESDYILEWLFNEARIEYRSLTPTQREDTNIRSQLATKYIALAGNFESQVDQKFDTIMNHLDAELSYYGYSKEVLDLYQTQYDIQKKELQNKMFNEIQ